MNNPYRVIIKNGVWFRELNRDFKTVNFPSQVVHHDKMVSFGKFFIQPHLFGYRAFQVRHQIHTNNPFNTFITIQLPKTDKVDIPTGSTIEQNGILNRNNAT